MTSERDGIIVTEGHVTEGQKVHNIIYIFFLLFQYTEIALSAASTPIYFSQNSDFKILDGCLKVLKYKV